MRLPKHKTIYFWSINFATTHVFTYIDLDIQSRSAAVMLCYVHVQSSALVKSVICIISRHRLYWYWIFAINNDFDMKKGVRFNNKMQFTIGIRKKYYSFMKKKTHGDLMRLSLAVVQQMKCKFHYIFCTSTVIIGSHR